MRGDIDLKMKNENQQKITELNTSMEIKKA